MSVHPTIAFRPPDLSTLRTVDLSAIATQPMVGRRVLDMHMQQQEQSNWCWLACACSTRTWYRPHSPVSQCTLASQLLGIAGCCGSPLPQGCDAPGLPSVALGVLGHLAGSKPINNLSFPEVQHAIDGARPLIIGYTADGQNVGHAVAVVGYEVSDDRDSDIYVLDPASGCHFGSFAYVLFEYSKRHSEVSFTQPG